MTEEQRDKILEMLVPLKNEISILLSHDKNGELHSMAFYDLAFESLAEILPVVQKKLNESSIPAKKRLWN